MDVAGRPAARVYHKVSYSSPHHAQVWFLRRSRDGWKSKYLKLKGEQRKIENRERDLTKSRDKWAAKARENVALAKELKNENAALKQEIEALKKST